MFFLLGGDELSTLKCFSIEISSYKSVNILRSVSIARFSLLASLVIPVSIITPHLPDHFQMSVYNFHNLLLPHFAYICHNNLNMCMMQDLFFFQNLKMYYLFVAETFPGTITALYK